MLRALLLALAGPHVAAGFDLTILHMNDDHSHLTEEVWKVDTSAVPNLGIAKTRVTMGGYPRIVKYLRAREEASTNVIKVHAGDTLTGTAYYSLFKGAADARMMSKVCFDVMALGNHEFDDGDRVLANFIVKLQGFQGYENCNDTAVIAGNVVPGTQSPIKDLILPYAIKNIGGEQVGMIGITVRRKTMEGSNPSHGTTLTDEATAAQENINTLKDQGVNKIVLVTHIGYEADKSLAQALSGVDVIIGGDSHSLLGGDAEKLLKTPTGSYPTELTNKDGHKVCVYQAWDYGHLFGEATVAFDADGKVTSCAGTPRIPFDDSQMVNDAKTDGERPPLTPDERKMVRDYLEGLGGYKAIEKDNITQLDLQAYQDEMESKMNIVIGTVPETLCYERYPGDGSSKECAVEDTRGRGSDLVGIVAKSQLLIIPGADMAIQQAGGVRGDLKNGDFTNKDAFQLLPYSNTLVTLHISGKQVKDALEEAVSKTLDDGGSTAVYPYASGLRWKVDLSQAKGSRFSSLEVPGEEGWTAMDMEKKYTVVANSFIAAGGDGYKTFGTASDKVDTFTEYRDGLIAYVKSVQTLVKLPSSEYSTQEFTDAKGVLYTGTGTDEQTVDGASSNLAGLGIAVATLSVVARFF